MQAPMFRMNERETNPNPYVGFIRSLRHKADHTDAEQILKAIAAQMKKIMEKRFMFVGTLEEAEFNRVFAGRNWNHGQSIELVLRNQGGRFLPIPYITSVMCHEMAHIEQMNHGPKFQKLMNAIKADVAEMQSRGNYGDGFWSDGQRLKDSVKMGAEGLRPSDFPEYVCGVTAGDARKARGPRRRGPPSSQTGMVKGEASHLSGRQTEYRRKAGRRNNVDMGEGGSRLDGSRAISKEDRQTRKEEIDEQTAILISRGMAAKTAKGLATTQWDERNPWFKAGSTRGKVAKSKGAAEMRAAAAEARLKALSSVAGPSEPKRELEQMKDEEEEEEVEYFSDDEKPDVEDPHMGVEERKKEMEAEMSESEKAGLRGGWEEFMVMDTSGPSKGKTTNGRTAKRGRSPAAEDPPDSKRLERFFGHGETKVVTPANGDGVDGWACPVCTFVNLRDHGRCSESRWWLWLTRGMCSARPDGSMPPDVII